MPKEPKRPKDLDTRFSTTGGSWVDVLAGRTGSHTAYYWFCRGCKDDAVSRPDRNQVVGEARGHAASCTAAHVR
ncbi:hypothetical protein OG875_04975 [Streptomyces sp. NBC_01498]|uniref:hypothetical protein n=1 Tax=Streptomyces sp. NBC_01498 TaxID=2975870 RepID=UPI002E7BB442|nr:hypothetical protein [Streptomyces sp. NBC_01498]WTL24010.1 hypothetical protein OG875_04975 [Streptomyces sp. NBC_01498]